MAVKDRGFASMIKSKVRSIARKGGKSSNSGGFKDKTLASEAGRKGGKSSH